MMLSLAVKRLVAQSIPSTSREPLGRLLISSSQLIVPILTERGYATTPELYAKAKAATKEATEGIGYYAAKQAAKERRRELWESRQARKERLKNRRKPDRFGKREEFRSFFIPEKVTHEYMERKARQRGLDWKLNVAVILERINVVLPDLEDWEEEYENLRDYLWQYGKDYPKGLNVDGGTSNPISNEELMALLPKELVPAPRETEADKSGDVKTIDRKLKTNIYLAVKEEGQSNWQLPTVPLNGDETLLDAAKRALKDKVGSEVEFWCPSNCPVAVDMSAFPEAEQKSSGLYGTKTFFMKVQYDEGNVKEVGIDDFAWLDRDEIVERVKQDGSDEQKSKLYHYLL